MSGRVAPEIPITAGTYSVTTNLTVSIYFDDTQTTQNDAISDLHRALDQAKQPGHFNRTLIEITFGEDHDPEPFTPADSDAACEECGELITTDSMLSNEHDPACSLHPANGSSTGCADTSEQAHHHRLWTTRAAGKAWAAAANTGTNERLEPQ